MTSPWPPPAVQFLGRASQDEALRAGVSLHTGLFAVPEEYASLHGIAARSLEILQVGKIILRHSDGTTLPAEIDRTCTDVIQLTLSDIDKVIASDEDAGDDPDDDLASPASLPFNIPRAPTLDPAE